MLLETQSYTRQASGLVLYSCPTTDALCGNGFPTIDTDPTIALDRSPAWEINLRVGAGMARSVDPLIVKMILGYRFDL